MLWSQLRRPLRKRALERPYVRPMDFTGRPMSGMVYVEPSGLQGAAVRRWVGKSLAFVESLPPKG